MKYTIVSWNCNGGFRNKFRELLKAYPDADIFVIQECEDPYFYDVEEFKRLFNNGFRIGSKQKGLAVIARDGITLKRLDWPNNSESSFAPVLIDGEWNLIAVWTQSDYVEDLHDFLDSNIDKFGPKTLMVGDFNSSFVFDRRSHSRGHAQLVERMDEIGQKPLYHYHSGDEQWKEAVPTFYWRRKEDQSFHIDHAFADPNYVMSFEVAPLDTHASWLTLSDHMPIKVVFDTDPQPAEQLLTEVEEKPLPPNSYYDENGRLHVVRVGVSIEQANAEWEANQKSERWKIRINMPGGRSISHPIYGEALKRMILELDWERIYRMGFEVHGAPLISQSKSKLCREIAPGWYLNCNMTGVKMTQVIKEIALAVGLPITTSWYQ